MATPKALNGKPQSGNTHGQFEAGEVSQAANPNRGSLHYNRIGFIDSLKGLLIVLVVLGHVLAGYMAAGLYPEMSRLMNHLHSFIYIFHIPLFFIICGYFSRCSAARCDEAASRRKLIARTLDFLWIYFVFSIGMVLFKALFSTHVNEAVGLSRIATLWYSPIGHYWFIYALAIYQLIYFALCKLNARCLSLVIVIGMAVSLFAPFGTNLWRGLYNWPFFVLGTILPDGNKFTRKQIMAMGLVALPATYVLMECGLPGYAKTLLHYMDAFMLSTILWSFFWKNEFCDSVFLRTIGKECLVIYVLHCFLTAALRSLLPSIGLRHFWLNILANVAISTFVPLFFAMALRKLNLYGTVFHPSASLWSRTRPSV